MSILVVKQALYFFHTMIRAQSREISLLRLAARTGVLIVRLPSLASRGDCTRGDSALTVVIANDVLSNKMPLPFAAEKSSNRLSHGSRGTKSEASGFRLGASQRCAVVCKFE